MLSCVSKVTIMDFWLSLLSTLSAIEKIFVVSSYAPFLTFEVTFAILSLSA